MIDPIDCRIFGFGMVDLIGMIFSKKCASNDNTAISAFASAELLSSDRYDYYSPEYLRIYAAFRLNCRIFVRCARSIAALTRIVFSPCIRKIFKLQPKNSIGKLLIWIR